LLIVLIFGRVGYFVVFTQAFVGGDAVFECDRFAVVLRIGAARISHGENLRGAFGIFFGIERDWLAVGVMPCFVNVHALWAEAFGGMRLRQFAGVEDLLVSDEFVADLLDLTAGGEVEAGEAVLPKAALSPDDQARLAIGSLFWWVVGYEASVGGARKRVSQIVFPDLPPMTQADLDRGRDWADWLYERWGLE